MIKAFHWFLIAKRLLFLMYWTCFLQLLFRSHKDYSQFPRNYFETHRRCENRYTKSICFKMKRNTCHHQSAVIPVLSSVRSFYIQLNHALIAFTLVDQKCLKLLSLFHDVGWYKIKTTNYFQSSCQDFSIWKILLFELHVIPNDWFFLNHWLLPDMEKVKESLNSTLLYKLDDFDFQILFQSIQSRQL